MDDLRGAPDELLELQALVDATAAHLLDVLRPSVPHLNPLAIELVLRRELGLAIQDCCAMVRASQPVVA